MRRINIKIIVFIICAVFILAGFTKVYIGTILYALKDYCVDALSGGDAGFNSFTHKADSYSMEMLRYHSLLMNIGSAKERLIGTRIAVKDGTVVIRTNNDSLTYIQRYMNDEELEKTAQKIKAVQLFVEANGAEFLYCAAPNKACFQDIPANVSDSTKDNYNRYLNYLSDMDVSYVELTSAIEKVGLPPYELYYYTDHHWLSNCGFAAYAEICKELSARYGFTYNESYTNIENYNVTTYKNKYLGSCGQKVGLCFSKYGADDIDLITPAFDTNITELIPYDGVSITGSFEDTTIKMEHLEKADYYGDSAYDAYCGGLYGMQIFKNNLLPEGKKVLFITDSYAQVVSPFLALQMSELHIADMRNFVRGRIDVEEYVKTMHPDYVIILFAGVHPEENAGNRYDIVGHD